MSSQFINPNPSITQTAVWTVSCLGGLSNRPPPAVKACDVPPPTGKEAVEAGGATCVPVLKAISNSALGHTVARHAFAVRLKYCSRSTRVLVIWTSVTGGIAHTGRKRAGGAQQTRILAVVGVRSALPLPPPPGRTLTIVDFSGTWLRNFILGAGNGLFTPFWTKRVSRTCETVRSILGAGAVGPELACSTQGTNCVRLHNLQRLVPWAADTIVHVGAASLSQSR